MRYLETDSFSIFVQFSWQYSFLNFFGGPATRNLSEEKDIDEEAFRFVDIDGNEQQYNFNHEDKEEADKHENCEDDKISDYPKRQPKHHLNTTGAIQRADMIVSIHFPHSQINFTNFNPGNFIKFLPNIDVLCEMLMSVTLKEHNTNF